MVMIDKQRLKIEFSERLNEACNDLGWPEKPVKPTKTSDGVLSRVQHLRKKLSKHFKISQPGIRKWFIGESVPDATNIGYVANALRVNLVWLTTGEGEKSPYHLQANNVESKSEASTPTLKENVDPKTQKAINCLTNPPAGRESMVDHLKDVLIDIWGEKTAKTFVDLNSKQDKNHSEFDK